MFVFDFRTFTIALMMCGVAFAQSSGCVSCHGMTDSSSMHTTGTVTLACTYCHGGNATIAAPANAKAGTPTYDAAKKRAHPQPKLPELWRSSANPVRPFADWLKESADYIRFVNPGDLRVATETCGKCHAKEVRAVSTSM